MNNFPYEGKSQLQTSGDAIVAELQQQYLKAEDILLGLVRPDSNVKLIAHFDKSLQSHLGLVGTGTGAIRYWAGKFSGSQGVLVEAAGTNLHTNPSAEVDLSGWSANDPAVALTQESGPTYEENDTVSVGSFKIAGTGDAGAGYVKSSLAVGSSTSYSASIYAYSSTAIKAKLEMSFSGGTPVAYDSGEVALAAETWTRIELENKASNDNTNCEIRIYLVQEDPDFASGSRLSHRTPTATAPVTDAAMSISAGDVVMCAVTANPTGPKEYAWHMVTAGATGVSGAALRLDDQTAAPTFVGASRFSQWAPAGGDSVLVTDGALVLNAGDFVFCNLTGEGYGWHLVTTGATGASSAALRLDDDPIAPDYVTGSRLTRFVPTATALVTDGAMAISAGDLVICRTLSNPASSGYAWHMVTTGGTGVSSSALRLDGQSLVPTFASGSRFSKLSPTGTALDTDGALVLAAGDFALCHPTRNPVETDYGWHMVTTGATGVSSSSLRLDQCSSAVLYADCVQVEQAELVSSFIDSYQGAGFSGSLGSSTSRAATKLSYASSGILSATAGTIAFFIYPFWAGDSGKEQVLFDAALAEARDRIRLSKSVENKLVFSIYDADGQLKQVVANTAFTFARKTWQHIAATYSSGTLKLYHNGSEMATTSVGSGSGSVTSVASEFFLGTDYLGNLLQGAVFDDLIIRATAASNDEIGQMAVGNKAYLGLSNSVSGLAIGAGNATTDASAGTQSSVAHGLGVKPAFVSLTPRSNGTVYLSAEADATNFYVKGSGSSLNFDWRAMA
ncbi:MAG: LamG domain-containing protein [Deltaproteobacteria bacterium]|nr:LamG domain-containing protein [Deltaproteobacteria bacterium]